MPCASSTNLPLRSSSTSLNPVALPPERARLSTSPTPIGSPTVVKTIGALEVWRLTATDALVPAE
jgi:hypothetical protein